MGQSGIQRRRESGFTLIGMVTVVIVVAILAAASAHVTREDSSKRPGGAETRGRLDAFRARADRVVTRVPQVARTLRDEVVSTVMIVVKAKRLAMATEADAGLGTIRTAMRCLYAQTGAYNRDLSGAPINTSTPITRLPGLNAGDLNGRWFDSTAYDIFALPDAHHFTIRARGNLSMAPNAEEVEGLVMTIDESGHMTRSGL